MNWWEQPVVWVAVIGLLSAGLGYYVKFLGDRSASKDTAHTSREQRIDAKIDKYTEKIEKRLDAVETEAEEARAQAEALIEEVATLTAEKKTLEGDVKTLKGQVESLEIERTLAERRELLLYRHTKALRDHIINELPPPPPTAPTELIDWFATFEDTAPAGLHTA